ncbi:MAG: NAD(P)-binding protein [Campylobacterales bacterium]|nr:NAD(P)-binding protein [Campylobacterales bacterium]
MIYDYIVVGSGVGGSLSASLLSKKNRVLLLEGTHYFGGCSGTFVKDKISFNAGATTFNGLKPDMPVGELIEKAGINLENIEEINPTITVIDGEKIIRRYKELDKFLQQLNCGYPHKNHRKFYEKVLEVNKIFYSHKQKSFDLSSITGVAKTIRSLTPLGLKLKKEFLANSLDYLKEYYPDIDEDYLNYLDNQARIVAQAKVKDISFLTLALALGYTFYDNYNVKGGIGEVFNTLLENVETVKNEKVIDVSKEKDLFVVKSKKNSYKSKKVILNSTVFNSDYVSLDKAKDYYQKKKEAFKISQGACVVYLGIRLEGDYNHHYQILEKQNFSNCISNSIFVSIPSKNDKKMVVDGVYGVTISTHTDINFWNCETQEEYEKKKDVLEKEIIDSFCKGLEVKKDKIEFSYLGTPRTFERFTSRQSVGGIGITMKNTKIDYPSSVTYEKGLYNIGDTVFAGQGWPGVAIGVKNLMGILGEEL